MKKLIGELYKANTTPMGVMSELLRPAVHAAMAAVMAAAAALTPARDHLIRHLFLNAQVSAAKVPTTSRLTPN